MKVFLCAKHWQLFLVTFGIPMLIEMVIFILAFASAFRADGPTDISNFDRYFELFPALMIVSAGGLFGWFWSIATGLHQYIPAAIQPILTPFKWFFFIPLIYICFISVCIFNLMAGIITIPSNGPPVGLIATFLFIIPLHLFSVFCIFYCLYFVAKTIKLAELQRPVSFSDFALEFFLIWFYPIGIWIVQPKINKMIAGDA